MCVLCCSAGRESTVHERLQGVFQLDHQKTIFNQTLPASEWRLLLLTNLADVLQQYAVPAADGDQKIEMQSQNEKRLATFCALTLAGEPAIFRGAARSFSWRLKDRFWYLATQPKKCSGRTAALSVGGRPPFAFSFIRMASRRFRRLTNFQANSHPAARLLHA